MDDISELLSSESSDEHMFHQKCLDSYTHPKTLKSIELKIAEEEQKDVPDNSEPSVSTKRSSHRKRDRLGRNTLLFELSTFFKDYSRVPNKQPPLPPPPPPPPPLPPPTRALIKTVPLINFSKSHLRQQHSNTLH